VKWIASGIAIWIVLLSMIVSASGCATTEPVTYCEPVTLYADRFVAIPTQMTQPVEIIVLSRDFDLPELGAAYKAQRVRAQQCNGRLKAIAELN